MNIGQRKDFDVTIWKFDQKTGEMRRINTGTYSQVDWAQVKVERLIVVDAEGRLILR